MEVLISGYPTPGAVPVELVGQTPILIAKVVVSILLGFALLLAGKMAWKMSKSDHPNHQNQAFDLIRLSLVPLGAYLLFTTTIHPWYVTLVMPFLPFLPSDDGPSSRFKYFLIPWIYFSIAVVFSYLTYIDPANLRETTWVRLVEYIPLYGLLIWTIWRSLTSDKKSEVERI